MNFILRCSVLLYCPFIFLNHNLQGTAAQDLDVWQSSLMQLHLFDAQVHVVQKISIPNLPEEVDGVAGLASAIKFDSLLKLPSWEGHSSQTQLGKAFSSLPFLY